MNKLLFLILTKTKNHKTESLIKISKISEKKLTEYLFFLHFWLCFTFQKFITCVLGHVAQLLYPYYKNISFLFRLRLIF